MLDLDATVQAPRPSVKLMNKSVHSDGPASVVQLGSQDELPEHATLTFFVQVAGVLSQRPENRSGQRRQ